MFRRVTVFNPCRVPETPPMDITGGPRDAEPPRRRTENCYLIAGVVALTAAAATFTISQLASVTVPQGLYTILVGLSVLGGCGWIVRSGDTQRACALEAGKNVLQQRLTAIEEQLATLTEQLAALAEQRETATRQLRPTGTCRPGGNMYVAGTQGETIGFRRGTVDGPTDPSGLSLQRAREDGIEQGFEIGYTAHLAEMGVTPLLPRARRSRLMGDS
ncbi:hypothetical protein [Micromonospora sp. NPDC049102]|uniref:hypothetical protein n=1 Tax=Micromonospora sp. NPDC049102 TaxID=3364265 RepID=UPI0037197314